MRKTIKDLPGYERPREKLLQKGPRGLKDYELLAVLLGKGTSKQDVLSLAEKLVPVIDERGLNLSVKDLTNFDGMGEAKAAQVGLAGGNPSLLYINGKPDHKIGNEQLVDEIERVIRAELQRRRDQAESTPDKKIFSIKQTG